MKILAIIPAFNEEKTVVKVIKEVKKELPRCDVLVVNDGSRDKTKEKVEKESIDLINLPYNLGIGAAVQTGFIFAKENNYDLAFQIDADEQHLANQIKKIIKPIQEKKADVIIGSRFLGKNSFNYSFTRRLGILIFQLTHQLLLGKKITDSTSGFRAYNKKTINFLAQNYADDYPEPEAVIKLIKNGFKVIEVFVRMQSRKQGSSSISSLNSFYYMIKVLLAIGIQSLQKSKLYNERS